MPDAEQEQEPTEEEADERDRPPTWAEQRLEIAEEPGNHGRFALGCTAAVVVLLAAFYLLRVFYFR